LAPDFLAELPDDFFRDLDFLEAEAEDLLCFLEALDFAGRASCEGLAGGAA
jgi:hypothetical protein